MLKKVMIGTAAWAVMGIAGVEIRDKFDPEFLDGVMKEFIEELEEDNIVRRSSTAKKIVREGSKVVAGSVVGPFGMVDGVKAMTKKIKERKDKIIEVEFYDFDDVVDMNEEAVA